MNGIHEVRGSIPLVSTNRINNLGHPQRCSFSCLVCQWCARFRAQNALIHKALGRAYQRRAFACLVQVYQLARWYSLLLYLMGLIAVYQCTRRTGSNGTRFFLC